MTHRGPFQPLLFCDSVISPPSRRRLHPEASKLPSTELQELRRRMSAEQHQLHDCEDGRVRPKEGKQKNPSQNQL